MAVRGQRNNLVNARGKMHDPLAASGERFCDQTPHFYSERLRDDFRIISSRAAESDGATRVCWKLLPE
jgi:hypothetical protein